MDTFRGVYKKYLRAILFGITTALTIYVLNKLFFDKEEKKDSPSIDDIQKYIEDLPLDTIKLDKNISLRELLAEIAEFSDDEEWKELIENVQNLL